MLKYYTWLIHVEYSNDDFNSVIKLYSDYMIFFLCAHNIIPAIEKYERRHATPTPKWIGIGVGDKTTEVKSEIYWLGVALTSLGCNINNRAGNVR